MAVADVFDALTSKRPKKRAWSNDEAIATLKQLSDEQLDSDCVNALVCDLEEVTKIQQQFREDEIG